MKPVLTAEGYRRVGKAYEGYLVRAIDRAGHAVALAAARAGAGYGKRIVVLAGPGNNGGDGYFAARYMEARGARMLEIQDPLDCDVVIDPLFGGGVREAELSE